MQRKCGLWCPVFILLAVSCAISVAVQPIKDGDLMVVIPANVPTDGFRPATDHHRRQRNATRSTASRRTSIPVDDGGRVESTETADEHVESLVARVKKKIKHKRTWDEPEAQASQVQNATTSKRPDRIKTRRRLMVPSSSTARALRWPVALQEDPYYDFGKKIKQHVSSSPAVALHNVLDSESRTSIKSPIVVLSSAEHDSGSGGDGDGPETAESAVEPPRDNSDSGATATARTRTQPGRNGHNAAAGGSKRSENLTECAYPAARFSRRNNHSRPQRNVVRCLSSTADPDSRTTPRILSTVVTSVSSTSVKGNQKRNDTRPLEPPTVLESTTVATTAAAAAVYHRPLLRTSSVISNPAEPTLSAATVAHPKHLRSRYRNISLPEYLEITKVNRRRLNGTTEAATVGVPTSISTLPSVLPPAVVDSTEETVVDVVTSTTMTMTTNADDGDTDASSMPPPSDIQDFIYLNNGTSESPATVVTANGHANGARQRRPPLSTLQRNNVTATKPSSVEHDVQGVVSSEGLTASTYLISLLAIVPLVLVIVFAFCKLAIRRKRKKVFDSSEYSSEYNRSPLDFNTVSSSPITTKLPRVPQHMVWDVSAANAADKVSSSPLQPTSQSLPQPLPPPPPLQQAAISLSSNNRWEFCRDKLRLQTILGQGNFGQVWKAEADDISGHEGLTRLVAVKMVKEGAASREREDLIRELGIMQHLGSHPNVVTLLACCTEKEPYLLIMEYVMYGKLLAFLRDRRTRSHYFNFNDSTASLTSRDLTVFAYCVARGMDFLVSKKIVHRDLAARNVLVDHNKLCKIADFGMSRNVRDTNQIYEQRHTKGALPIRWMAPESLHYSIFTYKTDVWSFGVLMWEIVTLGSTPYCTMGAREVMRRVREGYRLDKPAHCRSELFRVVSKCWAADPAKRPTFAELKQELGALLENPEFEGSYVDLESLVDESDNATKDRRE